MVLGLNTGPHIEAALCMCFCLLCSFFISCALVFALFPISLASVSPFLFLSTTLSRVIELIRKGDKGERKVQGNNYSTQRKVCSKPTYKGKI